MRYFIYCASLALVVFSNGVLAKQSVMLPSNDQNGMHIQSGLRLEKSHWVLWTSLKAQAYNPNGFITGDFIPYCQVSYQLKRVAAKTITQGQLPMRLTMNGPEYGHVIQLAKPGVYQLTIRYISPKNNGFYRHIDKATGVSPWWQPFSRHYQVQLGANACISKVTLVKGDKQ
ncbi:iron transporter [Celerinatantimonas sp. MCCC 1A17872]|uniref:iron transporter n=1 Tax=Celerinatantimonas sp. MCCC 1A17872 TaxID=3177514 RepID=UPI0038C8A7DA